jgi:hypothetical protein
MRHATTLIVRSCLSFFVVLGFAVLKTVGCSPDCFFLAVRAFPGRLDNATDLSGCSYMHPATGRLSPIDLCPKECHSGGDSGPAQFGA